MHRFSMIHFIRCLFPSLISILLLELSIITEKYLLVDFDQEDDGGRKRRGKRVKVADRRLMLLRKFNPRNGISRHAGVQYHVAII